MLEKICEKQTWTTLSDDSKLLEFCLLYLLVRTEKKHKKKTYQVIRKGNHVEFSYEGEPG